MNRGNNSCISCHGGVVFSMKLATKFMSYISPHFKGVTPALPCKRQKTETGKILLHVTQYILFIVHYTNKYIIGKIKCALYRVAQKWHSFFVALTLRILSNFQHYFTVRIRRKFVTILSLKIPPHLRCVATLRPCEM